MKRYHLLSAILAFGIFSSFTKWDSSACDYAGSNIDFIRSQTQNALDASDINISRYFAYKALNAIEKSSKQFEACGCDYAVESIYEGLKNLKLATRVSSLNGTRILLKRALDNTMGSLEALDEHEEMHHSEYTSDLLAMNTKSADAEKIGMKQPEGEKLHLKIDQFLVDYRNSLAKMIKTVECKEAHAFALRIYNHCELELLKPDLTEPKKYYNLKTKEITFEALQELKGCATDR